jgi:hypothetical protein
MKVRFDKYVVGLDGKPDGPAVIDTDKIVDVSVQRPLNDNTTWLTVIETEGNFSLYLRWSLEDVLRAVGWDGGTRATVPGKPWEPDMNWESK